MPGHIAGESDPPWQVIAEGNRRFKLGIAEVVTLCLYVALLVWAIPHHEPWADEAQAWQISRTLPLSQIFHLLPFEGHPGLWYVILWTLARLHVSYLGMRCVAAAFAFAGVAVLVTASPFPRFVKLLLPFTFCLAFQYAIVARSYVLAPLLLFLCAFFWTQRPRRPVPVALCLGLLANVALHAALISGGLAVVFLIDLWIDRRAGRIVAAKVYPAIALLLAFYAASILAAWPAKDAAGAGLVLRPAVAPTQAIETRQSLLPPRYPAAEPTDRHSLPWIAWELEKALTAGLTEGLVSPFWLGCLFWMVLTWKLFRRRQLHYLLPAILLVALCHIYAWFWHSGLMLPCVIALLWMTWPEHLPLFRKLPLYERSAVVMLLVIALVQISWAEYAFRFDDLNAYSSGRETAAFLKPYEESGAGILAIGNDFLSVAIQPYFDRKVFLNEPYVYYWWSTLNPAKLRFKELLAQDPALVVLEWRFHTYPTAKDVAAMPLAQWLNGLGYGGTHNFCGGLVSPGREVREWDCDLIFERQR